MTSIAIIGTGIAGMACGHFLHERYDVTFYEKNNYIGGHTNTVTVNENEASVNIDTGFIVYNEVTYPNLVRLFSELNVETALSSMTFSVCHQPTGLEYCGSGFNGLFAQRSNLLNRNFIQLLRQINRFNTECLELLNDEKNYSLTLVDFVKNKGFSEDFLEKYLVPMSSAIWSTEPDAMLNFPAVALVRFFKNHGLLGMNSHHTWRTVKNGSASYRSKLIAPFRDKIHTGRAAAAVTRTNGKAVVTDSNGERTSYDKVIFACHADQALLLLNDPELLEIKLLEPFRYQKNRAVLHSDSSVMPRTKRAWSSWNYRLEYDHQQSVSPSTTYYMNSLQPLAGKRDYFVSINDNGRIDESTIHYQAEYEHPIFSVEAMSRQNELPLLNENGVSYFCGSYFKYGFHEDALTSALELCRKLTGRRIWQ